MILVALYLIPTLTSLIPQTVLQPLCKDASIPAKMKWQRVVLGISFLNEVSERMGMLFICFLASLSFLAVREFVRILTITGDGDIGNHLFQILLYFGFILLILKTLGYITDQYQRLRRVVALTIPDHVHDKEEVQQLQSLAIFIDQTQPGFRLTPDFVVEPQLVGKLLAIVPTVGVVLVGIFK